jgi:ABC-type enterobactin transport system permease subunit
MDKVPTPFVMAMSIKVLSNAVTSMARELKLMAMGDRNGRDSGNQANL